MSDDIHISDDVSPDISESAGSDTSSDFGGELAGDIGVDLNDGNNDSTDTESNSGIPIETLPDNRGAVPGTECEATLPRGTIGVRYGNPETGVFAAPYDTPPDQLNLPLSNSGEPNYFVVTDHNGIPVTESIAALDNNQPGGTQWDFGEGNPISGYDHRHYPDTERGEK